MHQSSRPPRPARAPAPARVHRPARDPAPSADWRPAPVPDIPDIPDPAEARPAGPLLRLAAWLRLPGNSLAFVLRRWLKPSPGRPELAQEDKDGWGREGGLDARALGREADLRRRYWLGPLARQSTRTRYRRNLRTLELLEQAAAGLPAPGPRPLRALDIGCGSWDYVFALERWLRHWGAPEGREVELAGLEADGYRRGADRASIGAWAKVQARQTGNPRVRFEAGDFLRHSAEGWDVLTCFYPYLSRYGLLLQGLPLTWYRPLALLRRAAAALAPDGHLLVFTHTRAEWDRLVALADRVPGLERVAGGPARLPWPGKPYPGARKYYATFRRAGAG